MGVATASGFSGTPRAWWENGVLRSSSEVVDVRTLLGEQAD